MVDFLTKKVIRIKNQILAIGAAHIDRKAIAQSEVQLKTSIPVSVTPSYGGVARNVAENIARFNMPINLISRVGKDREGESILHHLQQLNIGTSELSMSETHNTATYTALLDATGEMVLALADMEIYNELNKNYFKSIEHIFNKYTIWFIDTNLPKESVRYITSLKKRLTHVTLLIDPVSVPKAERLIGSLDGIDFIFPNRDELEKLSGIKIRNQTDLERAGDVLLRQGVKNIIVTLGAEGVLLINNTSKKYFSALKTNVVDVTGAGDSFVAGFIYGLGSGWSLEHSIEFALAVAALTVSTVQTVHPELSVERVTMLIKQQRNDEI